jgi:hypothetical protein
LETARQRISNHWKSASLVIDTRGLVKKFRPRIMPSAGVTWAGGGDAISMSQETTQPQTAQNGNGRPAQPSRFQAAMKSFALDRRICRAQADEKKILAESGEKLSAAGDSPAANHPDTRELCERVRAAAAQLATLDDALKQSLENDRCDFAMASQLMRWIVITRGISDRWILRDRMRHHRREHAELSYNLGRVAFDGSHETLCGALPGEIRKGVETARAEAEAARAERENLLAPWHGEPLPPFLATAAGELCTFLRHLWKQLSSKLFMRAPALAALVAGWWIAHHYTTSTIETIRHSLGLGGRKPIDAETLRRMSFWIPIVAAAFCSWICAFIASRIQRIYAPQDRAKNRPAT